MDTLTPEDIKWLRHVRELEAHGKQGRPLPSGVQQRLRYLGLIELRKGKTQVTAKGLQAMKNPL